MWGEVHHQTPLTCLRTKRSFGLLSLLSPRAVPHLRKPSLVIQRELYIYCRLVPLGFLYPLISLSPSLYIGSLKIEYPVPRVFVFCVSVPLRVGRQGVPGLDEGLHALGEVFQAHLKGKRHAAQVGRRRPRWYTFNFVPSTLYSVMRERDLADTNDIPIKTKQKNGDTNDNPCTNNL